MDKTSKESMENLVENENETEDENVFENENNDNDNPITLEEILEAWNPMEQHYYSSVNNYHYIMSPPEYQLFHESIPALETAILDLQIQDNFSTDDLVEGTEIVQLPIAYISDLEEKNYAEENCIMEVTVAYAKHPWYFFVNCDRGWGCHYEITEVIENNYPKILTREALEESLTTYLFDTLSYKSVELKHMDYFEEQLVAVLLTRNENEKVFVRANVKRDTFDDEPGPHRKVKVQLLDSGENVEVNIEDICLLPMSYVLGNPCLAYQCSLFGVSPLSSEWTPEASAYFSKLVVEKKCLLTVKKSTVVMGETPQNPFEFLDPYKVELRVRCENTECLQYHNVSELLAEKFHGVLWNLTLSGRDAEGAKPRS